MQQTELLHRRNQLIYSSYFIFFIIHCVCVFLNIFSFQFYYQYAAATYLTITGVLLILKVDSRIVRAILIVGNNLFMIYLIWQSLHIFNIFWLIVYLLLITIYKSHTINFTLTIVVFVEGVLLLKFHPCANFNDVSTNIIVISIFLFMILLLSFALQTIYIRNIWQKVETRHIEKERELLSREAYLRLFFEHANDSIAVFDLDERIIEVNPAFEKLYGWKREECIGRVIPLVPPANKNIADERLQRLLQGESFTLIETQDMRKDGTTFDAQISLSPIYNNDGEMIALSVLSRDISYIKENERLLLNAEKLKLAGELAASVAHEIRNPMTVISGFVQMMNMDEASPYQQYTELIQTEIERIDLIISEFLVLSRPQVVQKERLNIVQVIHDVTSLFQIEMANHNIQLQLKQEVDEAIIEGNVNQIKQVLINIFKNALEAIQHDGHIEINVAVEQQKVVLLIRDDGVGIPEHILKYIFEPFYTTKSKGTGLGMMITHKIIQDHHGDIKVSSTEHVGTDVCIYLPLTD